MDWFEAIRHELVNLGYSTTIIQVDYDGGTMARWFEANGVMVIGWPHVGFIRVVSHHSSPLTLDIELMRPNFVDKLLDRINANKAAQRGRSLSDFERTIGSDLVP